MRAVLITLLTAAWATAAAADEQTVQLTKKADAVEVTIGGEPFAVYNFSEKLPKPFFWPVRGPDGTILTRPIITQRSQGDHPHHKGLWLAIDEVNEVDFWAEKGKIRTVEVTLLEPAGSPAKFRVVNHWLSPEEEPVVIEKTTISVYPDRLIAYDISFHPHQKDVTFHDTKEGLLGFRMVDSMRENEGGTVVSSDGLKGSRACWGRTADWIDYYGTVDGRTFGVALFDHPGSFRKSRYHVRNYGLFSISPFGERAYTGGRQPARPVTIKAGGEPLRLRYGIYIHAGDTETADVAAVYHRFVKATRR